MPTFSFTPVTGATRGQTYTASSTFTSADSTFHVWTTSGAEFQINSGGYSTTTKTAEVGDVVYVRNIASGSYSTLSGEVIVAGGYSRTFDVTTGSAPPVGALGGAVKGSNGKLWKDSTGKVIKVRP